MIVVISNRIGIIIRNVLIVLIVSGNLLAPCVAAGLIPSGNLQKREELTLPEREPCPATRSLLMRLFHQTREKENMGALPLMALLPGVRPVLVATPWVLVPKGVQVHRASDDRPTSHRPIAQWTRRHTWPTGHAWSLATEHARSPGTHWAFADHQAKG